MFDRLKQAANETKFKADQMLREQRVQNDIAGIKQQLNAMRDRIGGTVLELHQRGGLGIPELDELCAAADALNAQIAQKEAQVAAIKAEGMPGAAPAPQHQQQGYAPQPGFTPPPPPAYAPQPGYAPPQAATKPCPNCHAAVPAPAMFCTTCGFNFQQAQAPVAAKATKTCPNCQFEAPVTSGFCPNCGKGLA